MEVTILSMCMLLALTAIVAIYRIEIAKKQLIKPKKVDKEKVKQELQVLKNKTGELERKRILGYITEEEFQREMAKIDTKLKEMEKELHD